MVVLRLPYSNYTSKSNLSWLFYPYRSAYGIFGWIGFYKNYEHSWNICQCLFDPFLWVNLPIYFWIEAISFIFKISFEIYKFRYFIESILLILSTILASSFGLFIVCFLYWSYIIIMLILMLNNIDY